MSLTTSIRSRLFNLAIGAAIAAVATTPCYADALAGEKLSPDVQMLVDAGMGLEAAEAAAEDGEAALLAAMITIVAVHDIAVVAGVLPFPSISYGAEVTEFSSNLGLKALPPRFFPPPNQEVDPAAGNGAGYTSTSDGCGIEFELLSPQGGYSNLFGIANIRDPYTSLATREVYRWRNFSDPDSHETRWGFLRAPKVYHANTGVGVEIHTPGTVRKFVQNEGSFGADVFEGPRVAIDTFAESPQTVYLPIGDHSIEWHATTQIETVGDIAVPGIMLLFNTLSELKNIYGGRKAAKLAKKGIEPNVADEALDAAGAKRLTDGVKRFEDVWQKAFESRQARKAQKSIFQKIMREIRGDIRNIVKKLVKEVLKNLLVEMGKAGINSIDGHSKDVIRELYGPVIADWIEIAWRINKETNPGGLVVFTTEHIIAGLDDHALAIIRRVLTEKGSGHLKKLLTIDTAGVVKYQAVRVLNSVPPTITIDPTPVIIEATDFGGTRLSRSRARLTEEVQKGVTYNCGRLPELIMRGASFLPLGDHEVTWTAKDPGPNVGGDAFAPQATQYLRVQDTQPPLILAPPSKVILDTADVSFADAGIGDAVAIDLVDVQPQITNDAPAIFPVNTRTTIQWEATDDSANSAQSEQLITVKDSNTAPTASDAAAATLTAEPVDIRLTANDVDELGGRFDPLWFKIESQPKKGEFIAPLYPFFIEDYRTRPGDGLGDNYDPATDNVASFIRDNFCANNRSAPNDFVHEALFVHVTDDGTRYVLDTFYECGGTSTPEANEFSRFSQWGPTGDFQGHIQIGTSPSDAPVDDAFRVDRDGFLYYNTLTSGSTSSAELRLHQCPLDFQGRTDLSNSDVCDKPPFRGFTFKDGITPNRELDPVGLAYSRFDSNADIAYVVDANSLLAFEPLESGSTRFIGELGPKDDQGVVLDDWFGKITSLEVGSDGALYANDINLHRIHKLGPISVDDQGEYVLGEYIGWAGKCTDSGNNACEVDPAEPEKGHSRGYSCTYETNSCTVAPADMTGPQQGQFNSPRYIAIDPNDVLYVADFDNSRIQRFSPDGTFAGEAVSEGSGVNKGDRPSFVIGNMGKPASVAVNSSQFFVVDRDEQFVHIFGTLPFKDITDDEATVTYVSDQDFPNPLNQADDSFTFSVSDGLEESAPATVTIAVSRNFRPPEALEETITVDEDSSVDFTLPVHDPDGIAGKDFLGLDTITYSLVRWPENGTLSGYGDSWSYTPHPDFYGEDSLTFMANDGVFDSNEGTLTFDVTPMNDPPVVTIELPERVALGFPTQIASVFTDDRLDKISSEVSGGFTDGYLGDMSWGDGTTDTTGEFMNDGDDVGTQGVIVVAPSNAESEGRTFAEHTFEQEGENTVEVCVTDNGGEIGCDSVTVIVEPLVSMGAGGIFYDGPLPDDEVTQQEIPDATPFQFEALITNGAPSAGDGVTAEDVTLELTLPEALLIADISIEQGNCTRDLQEVACDIGPLDPGAEVGLTMSAIGPGILIYDEDRDFVGTLSTSSEALSPELGLFATVTLIANTTDTDGDGMSDTFEVTYRLNPLFDDAALDADGDGLNNGDEYEHGTSPRENDTDGDGVFDGAEVLAGTDPLFDDIAPELTIPADIQVNATGILTAVNLGSATAVDFKDGSVDAVPNDPGPFLAGPNVVTWTALDEAGNRTQGFQFVNVVPMANFQVDQTVSEGALAKARVELTGNAVEYPVTVPYDIGGSALNPDDHDGLSGEAIIESGLSTEIDIGIIKDLSIEPDETIVLTMGAPANAVAGANTTHVITVSEVNQPPKVSIEVEQQGRRTTTIASGAGLIALIADVRDDPAQDHGFDWSNSDPQLIDPVAVNDPAYLLDPVGLGAGMYDMRVSVTDDGVPLLNTNASSLLNVSNEQLILLSSDDSDGDGISDAVEGPDDADGDRIANYLDDVPNSNVLRLAADDRMLETATGLTLRLGATAFSQESAFASVKEQDFGTDIENGYGSDVQDFEITSLDPGASANVVLPLAIAVSEGSEFRTFGAGQWRDFVETADEHIASAPGEKGACPPPGNNAYSPGLTTGDGCLQLTLTDGGSNDLDGIADSVVRFSGGLAAPVSASAPDLPQVSSRLTGDGDYLMLRTRLHSVSGDALVNALTLQASGDADDTQIDDVILIHDTNRDGEWDDDDIQLSNGQYTVDDGILTLALGTPFELPVGDTDLLIIYIFGETE